MNIQQFKNVASKWKNSSENFAWFRKWAENCYTLYRKKKNLDFEDNAHGYSSENDFKGLEEYDSWVYEWEYIYYDHVIKLYNKMNWDLDDYLKDAKSTYDVESESFYYQVSFDQVYNKIQQIEDNIEFYFALLTLVKFIHENQMLYKEYVLELKQGIKECNLNESVKLLEKIDKVFIAMSFEDKMEPVKDSIIKAIEACGYGHMRIDIKEHNNQIVPEIFKEIEDCKFVIADLTGQRGGVYLEAGYALAKGKPLILSCSIEEKDKIHFDVAQINTIFWSNEELNSTNNFLSDKQKNLTTKLMDRIKSTIGEN